MERVTATLPPETLAKIRRVAGPRGVSSFLNTAAVERLSRVLRESFASPSRSLGSMSSAKRRNRLAFAGIHGTTGRASDHGAVPMISSRS